MAFPAFCANYYCFSLKDKSSQDDAGVADEAEASAIGPSDGVSFPICSNTEALDAVSQTNQFLYATSETNETLGTGSVTHESGN